MKRIIKLLIGIILVAIGIYVLPSAFEAKTSFIANFWFSISGAGIFFGFLFFLLSFGNKQ